MLSETILFTADTSTLNHYVFNNKLQVTDAIMLYTAMCRQLVRNRINKMLRQYGKMTFPDICHAYEKQRLNLLQQNYALTRIPSLTGSQPRDP